MSGDNKSGTKHRKPTKKDALEAIKELGIDINTVLDVGVFTCTPELISAFPDLKQVLFEPLLDKKDTIDRIYSKSNIDYELYQLALSDASGVSYLNLVRDGSGNITHSHLSHEKKGDSIEIAKVRLDSFLEDRFYVPPYLLKVDVDGHDINVLNGAKNTLNFCSCVIVEAVSSKIRPTISLMEENGFDLWDIIDICYSHGTLWQVDLFFVRKEIYSQIKKKPSDPKSSSYAPWDSLNKHLE